MTLRGYITNPTREECLLEHVLAKLRREPVFTTLLAIMFMHEKLEQREWIGIIRAVVGMVILRI